jgi:hypothetical protein
MAPRSNAPARFPPGGSWPAVLRADMAAAYLDYPDTQALSRAVVAGEAPPPSCMRKAGAKREPVWAKEVLTQFVARVHAVANDNAPETESIRDLV